jgi:predicted transcriptional regulator
MIAFAKHLRQARKSAKLSAREVSEAISISMTFIYDCERGDKRPSLETVVKLSQLYKDPSLVNDFMRINNIGDVEIDVSMSADKERVFEELSSISINDGHKIGKKLMEILSTNDAALTEWTRTLNAFICKYDTKIKPSGDESK